MSLSIQGLIVFFSTIQFCLKDPPPSSPFPESHRLTCRLSLPPFFLALWAFSGLEVRKKNEDI
jgi:hypothetical protein